MMAVTAAAVCGQADGAAVRYAYQAGLEGLPRAETVRLVASREDRRAVCSLVLGVPLDSAGSARLQACYALFRREAAALCAQAEGGAGGEAGGARAVAALEAAARGALEQIHVVVFELPDGVAAESMYELFAQRERALGSLFCTFSGVAMGEADLVRNLLLAHVADEEARTQLLKLVQRVVHVVDRAPLCPHPPGPRPRASSRALPRRRASRRTTPSGCRSSGGTATDGRTGSRPF